MPSTPEMHCTCWCQQEKPLSLMFLSYDLCLTFLSILLSSSYPLKVYGKKTETRTKPNFPSPFKHCNFTPDFSNLTIIQTNLLFSRWSKKLEFHCDSTIIYALLRHFFSKNLCSVLQAILTKKVISFKNLIRISRVPKAQMIHAFFVNCLFVKEMGSNLQTFSSCVMICIYAQKGKKCKREFTLGGLNVCNDNFYSDL